MMDNINETKNLLVGDIGGTKTTLAIFTSQAGPHEPLFEKTFHSLQYESLEIIVDEFLSGLDLPVESGCFGVAGPVFAGRARITNLTWWVDEASLKSAFGMTRVKLLNDLESVAYAIPILEPGDIHTLNTGEPVPGGSISVIAPGTGLGEAFLTRTKSGYQAHATEGSHATFGPIDQLQMDLLTYMWTIKGFDHVSYERVCSGGLGIPNLYAFLKDTGRSSEPAWLAEELASSDDPTPVIIRVAQDQDNPCELCVETLNLFVSILASEAGNQALKVFATGGIYIGGGIPTAAYTGTFGAALISCHLAEQRAFQRDPRQDAGPCHHQLECRSDGRCLLWPEIVAVY
jgi:glucokinase